MMAPNPNPSRITEASWWFMEQLLALEPSNVDQNGGIYASKPGYHNTRAANRPGNYSVQLPEDKRGPSDKAAAYDWTFLDAQAGRYATIIKYSYRLLLSGANPRDDRLNGWREFYGQADLDQQVEGWDFQAVEPSTSDPSHLWHIHLSELRQFVGDFDNKKKMLSVLRGESYDQWLASQRPEEEEMIFAAVDVPQGYAYDKDGNLIDASKRKLVSFPPNVELSGGWYCVGVDGETDDDDHVKVRVAANVEDGGWDVRFHDVYPENRIHSGSVDIRRNYGKFSVGRCEPDTDDEVVKATVAVLPVGFSVAK